VLSSFLQATNSVVVAEIKRSDKLSFLFNIYFCLEYEITGSAFLKFILNINILLSNLENHIGYKYFIRIMIFFRLLPSIYGLSHYFLFILIQNYI